MTEQAADRERRDELRQWHLDEVRKRRLQRGRKLQRVLRQDDDAALLELVNDWPAI